jgi:hypothetical protein
MFGLDRKYFPLWLIFSENATLILSDTQADHIKMFSYLFHLGFALVVRGLTRGVSGDDLSTSPLRKLLCLSRLPFSADNIFSILFPNPSYAPFNGQSDEVYCVFFTGGDCSGGVTACYLSFYSSEYFDTNSFPYQYYTLI